MAVSLGTTKNVVVRPAESVSVSELNVLRWIDRPSDKVVLAFVKEINNPVVLWEGDAYDAAGDWTQAQAEARLATVVNAM